MTISNIGSRNSTTTFFKSKSGINVSCGCFYGDVEEFEKQVKQVHHGNRHEKIYLKAIELAKLQILE